MITYENGLFSIQEEQYSYLFRVNDYGLLEHLYFGAPVSDGDAAAFRLRSGLGWGCSVLLNEQDLGSCPDVMALEWSSSGRGDYRESPLALAESSMASPPWKAAFPRPNMPSRPCGSPWRSPAWRSTCIIPPSPLR